MAPWNGPEPESAYDILAMDGALQFLPWRHYMLESYREAASINPKMPACVRSSTSM